jgi:hypothetical protein
MTKRDQKAKSRARQDRVLEVLVERIVRELIGGGQMTGDRALAVQYLIRSLDYMERM